MITIEMLENLKENDGYTLLDFEPITYPNGYQVATEGVECHSPAEAYKAIKAYHGNCGIWLEKGIYYIDLSWWVEDKVIALRMGREANQISILDWSDMSLIYC